MFQADVDARKAAKTIHAPAARLMYSAQPGVMQALSAITGVSIEHGSTVALCCVVVCCTHVQVTYLFSRLPIHVCSCLAVSTLTLRCLFELMCHIEA